MKTAESWNGKFVRSDCDMTRNATRKVKLEIEWNDKETLSCNEGHAIINNMLTKGLWQFYLHKNLLCNNLLNMH